MLPDLRPDGIANESPHVLILGAGASRAACPKGDRNGRPLPLMADLVETVGLTQIVEEAGISRDSHANFENLYGEIAADSRRQDLRIVFETKIRDYFDDLELPNHVTVYDKLLLSLRKKDMIATFNWDPFLAQAYRRNSRSAWLPEIAFLHGNVAAGICHEHKRKGFYGECCRACDKPYEQSRLLYPVADKAYRDDAYISGEWACL